MNYRPIKDSFLILFAAVSISTPRLVNAGSLTQAEGGTPPNPSAPTTPATPGETPTPGANPTPQKPKIENTTQMKELAVSTARMNGLKGQMDSNGASMNEGVTMQYAAEQAYNSAIRGQLNEMAQSGKYDTSNYEKSLAMLGSAVNANSIPAGGNQQSNNENISNEPSSDPVTTTTGGFSLANSGASASSPSNPAFNSEEIADPNRIASEQTQNAESATSNSSYATPQGYIAIVGPAATQSSSQETGTFTTQKSSVLHGKKSSLETNAPAERGLASLTANEAPQDPPLPVRPDQTGKKLPAAPNKNPLADSLRTPPKSEPTPKETPKSLPSQTEDLGLQDKQKFDSIYQLGSIAGDKTTDLGNWILQSLGVRKNKPKTPPAERSLSQEEKSSDPVAFGIGAVAVVLLTILGGIILKQRSTLTKVREENEIFRSRRFLIDPKVEDCGVSLEEENGRRIAVIKITNRRTKKSSRGRELIAGSNIPATYLPFSVCEANKFNKGDVVEYAGQWKFVRTDKEIEILVRVYSDEENLEKPA